MSDWETVSGPTNDGWETVHSPTQAPSGFVQGLRDPVDAGAQLLTHILPDSVVHAGNSLNNWLADHGVPLTKIPEGGIDQLLSHNEAQYQAQRKSAGETGTDWGRVAGNVVSPVSLSIGRLFTPLAGASMAARVGLGAASGAASGALQPVTGGDYWTEKGKQTALGGVAGAVLPAVTGAAARVVSPNTSQPVKALMAEGVQPTVGQTLGGLPKKVEDMATSIPFLGQSINSARSRSIDQFNRAAVNRALTPIGESLPKDVPTGKEALSYAIDKLSEAYNNVLPNLSGKADQQFVSDVTNIGNMVQSLPDAQKKQFMDIVKNEVADRFTTQGLASGESLNVMDSQLGNFVRGFRGNQDYNVRKLGEALGEVQSSIRDMLMRNNPQYATELSKIRLGYANLKRVEQASSSVANDVNQAFTPAQLKRAVKALSPTKRQFAKGDALMQDLANAGKEVLPNSVPNSGTADRAMLAYILANPVKSAAAAVPAILGSSLYTPLGQKAVNWAITARPQVAGPVANAIHQSTPFMLPGLIPYLYPPQQQ